MDRHDLPAPACAREMARIREVRAPEHPSVPLMAREEGAGS